METDLRIVVLHRGWVLVGDYERIDENMSKLTNAGVIRRWGTDRGLGELAYDGPQSDTIIDIEPESEFHQTQIIRTIKCERPDLWKSALKR